MQGNIDTEGPFVIHRRLVPVVQALMDAGFTVKWVTRWSGDQNSYLHPLQSGVRSVYVLFADGYKAGVTDNWPNGDHPEWYFDKDIDHKYHLNDLPEFLVAVTELSLLHGGK